MRLSGAEVMVMVSVGPQHVSCPHLCHDHLDPLVLNPVTISWSRAKMKNKSEPLWSSPQRQAPAWFENC